MARLCVLSGSDVCRILSRHGFQEIRRKGSHIIMQKKIGIQFPFLYFFAAMVEPMPSQR
ncbi:MAG: type II toxin-antitoxin system HicA family toxin [Deltaproteobacteria bacterium]|nr:type II toxin-antitoxin system HicA family toxin [Deltaproteobacteria bacterium]